MKTVIASMAFTFGFATLAQAYPSTNWFNLPLRVRQTISNQVQAYFGSNTLKGIPLLDFEQDWSDFRKWPDQFTFEGETLVLNVTGWDIDYLFPLSSRPTNILAVEFYFRYAPHGKRVGGPLAPTTTWTRGNRIERQSVLRNGAHVFGLVYAPTGEIMEFFYYDPKAGQRNRHEYYSPSGEVVGLRESSGRNLWKGKEVTIDQLQSNWAELWKRDIQKSTTEPNP